MTKKFGWPPEPHRSLPDEPLPQPADSDSVDSEDEPDDEGA